MPRRPRSATPASFFHVINRTARRVPIFIRPNDYRAFVDVLDEGLALYPIQLLAYCVMSNHWHLVLGSSSTSDLSGFMRWVSATHAIRWHHRHGTVGQGALYKGRFQARPIDNAASLVRVCRYVERNALAAGLVKRAEDWPWCSLSERFRSDRRLPLAFTPFLVSSAWLAHVNAPATPADLAIKQECNQAMWEDTNPTSVPHKPKSVGKTPVPERRRAPKRQQDGASKVLRASIVESRPESGRRPY
jgi:putative transposase